MSLPTPWQQHAADLFAVTLTPEQVAAFGRYARELVQWNAHTNLTAITDPDAIPIRHFLDSLSIAKAISLSDGLRIIDVGSGAGFPGLPLAIAYPGIEVTLLESTGKKSQFLKHVIQTLDLPNTTTIHARAEEAGQDPIHRAQYDLAVARAVARLPALLEYLLPFVKLGGHAIAMKGSTAPDEVTASTSALNLLGGTLDRIETVALPGLDDPHHLVIVQKTAPTPDKYPRRTGVPTKRPL